MLHCLFFEDYKTGRRSLSRVTSRESAQSQSGCLHGNPLLGLSDALPRFGAIRYVSSDTFTFSTLTMLTGSKSLLFMPLVFKWIT